VDALALRSEEDQDFHRLRPCCAKPMRRAGVEFGRLAGSHDEIQLGEP
jgi:hypothetical protein